MTNTHHDEEEVSDTRALINSIKENPLLYIGGVSVLVVVVIATLLFQLNNNLNAQDQATAYASAVDIEDPMERMETLGAITQGSSKYMAEALYLQGYAALESEDYETATIVFTTLREKHPDFEFTPDGVEGLGIVHEMNDDFAAAIAVYKDIQATWPESFAARRQPFNIGRCHEEDGNAEEALKAYEDQLQTFPGSNVATHAQQKMDLLLASNPTLEQAPTSDILPALEASPEATN